MTPSRGYDLGRIRAEAADLDSGFINFKHGLQLAGTRLYRRSDPSNAFISRVEQPPFESPPALPHAFAIERYPVRQVEFTAWVLAPGHPQRQPRERRPRHSHDRRSPRPILRPGPMWPTRG